MQMIKLFVLTAFSFLSSGTQQLKKENIMTIQPNIEIATLGGGCFWCTEAVFEGLKGVISVESGYSGGNVKNPSYREVCTGNTGHAEVIQIRFDPTIISYAEILEVFFHSHNPTTRNQQGADMGTQYRSVIFYHNQSQKTQSEQVIKKITENREFNNPIVTEIVQFSAFYKAEDYHQDYFSKNPNAAYCSHVIRPKVEKVQMKYSDKLK